MENTASLIGGRGSGAGFPALDLRAVGGVAPELAGLGLPRP